MKIPKLLELPQFSNLFDDVVGRLQIVILGSKSVEMSEVVQSTVERRNAVVGDVKGRELAGEFHFLYRVCQSVVTELQADQKTAGIFDLVVNSMGLEKVVGQVELSELGRKHGWKLGDVVVGQIQRFEPRESRVSEEGREIGAEVVVGKFQCLETARLE